MHQYLQCVREVGDPSANAGVLLYLLPMGTGNVKGDDVHGWGTPLHSFWCCYGSSVESFAKLVDSIYFYRSVLQVVTHLWCDCGTFVESFAPLWSPSYAMTY